MTPHQWHRVIDDVARDLTAGDPDAGFRARVLERVATAPPTRSMMPSPALAWVWRGTAAVAALGLVAIAAGVLTPSRVVPPANENEIVRDIGARPLPLAVADASSGRAEAASVPVSPRAVSQPDTPRALVEWRARNIAALNDVAPLAVDHDIQPEGLAISQLSVAPLGIAPLVIPAIDDDR